MKIRRRGRHATPSQVEKVATQAGKAAPAVAIAGALVAAPQAQPAVSAAVQPATTTTGAHQAGSATFTSYDGNDTTAGAALVHETTAKAAATRTYTVRSGDTLASIANRYYHNQGDWQWLDHVNAKTIANPNLIYAGQKISVPVDPPAHYTLPASYQPKHAAPVTTTSHQGGSSSSGTTTQASGSTSRGGYGGGGPSGNLGCSGLEQLWVDAGGSPGHAFMAAEIAMAESGGSQYAHSPTDDFGYWQINASNGALATYDARGNAKSAIILSQNGTNWDPWTTYTSGAYQGKC